MCTTIDIIIMEIVMILTKGISSFNTKEVCDGLMLRVVKYYDRPISCLLLNIIVLPGQQTFKHDQIQTKMTILPFLAFLHEGQEGLALLEVFIGIINQR